MSYSSNLAWFVHDPVPNHPQAISATRKNEQRILISSHNAPHHPPCISTQEYNQPFVGYRALPPVSLNISQLHQFRDLHPEGYFVRSPTHSHASLPC